MPVLQVVTDRDSGLTVVADVRAQLAAQVHALMSLTASPNAATRSSSNGTLPLAVGPRLSRGDVFTLVLPVCPTKPSEVGAHTANSELDAFIVKHMCFRHRQPPCNTYWDSIRFIAWQLDTPLLQEKCSHFAS